MSEQRTAQAHITIVDNNDIERIYVVYAKHTSNTDSSGLPNVATWTESISSAPGSGSYIWQCTVVEKSGTHSLSYGNPVCVTGPQGGAGDSGRGITSIVTTYCNYGTGTPAASYSGWQSGVPEYDSTKPNYWVKTVITYTKGSPATDTSIYKDNGLTDAISKAATANTNAANALNKANSGIIATTQLWYQTNSSTAPSVPTQHTQVDVGSSTVNNWRSTRPTNAITSYKYYYYCYEYKHGDNTYTYSSQAILDTSNLSQYEIGVLDAQVKNFWWDSNGAHIASGIGGNDVDKNSVSTYGYNTLTALTGISFKYNDAKVVDLNSTTPSLDFYQPPTISGSGSTVTQGALAATFNGDGMIIYKDSIDVAHFGEEIRIGSLNGNYLQLESDTIQGFNSNGSSVLNIGLSSTEMSTDVTTLISYDLTGQPNETKSCIITELSTLLTSGANFRIRFEQIKNGKVVATKSCSYKYGTSSIALGLSYNANNNKFSYTIASGENGLRITGVGYTKTTQAPTWSFGTRKTDDTYGAFSYTAGKNNSAQGDYSIAIGDTATATDTCSVAVGRRVNVTAAMSCGIGYEVDVTGYYAFAGGNYSEATNSYAFAYGTFAKANGESSIALGDAAWAYSNNQTAIGKYNEKDANGDYVFIIGNGINNARSNALTVDWSGNVNIASGAKYKINGTNLSASDVGAVPTSRTVNSKALSSNITLTADDVSAVALSNKYTRSSVGTLDWTDTTEGDAKVITKSALTFWNGAYSGTSSNLAYCNKGAFGTLATKNSLSASDVGAVPTSRTVNNKALSSNISLTASDVGAVPTSRTVNNKALSSDITLTASDVGALPTVTAGDDTGKIILGDLQIVWGYTSVTTGSTAQNGGYSGSSSITFGTGVSFAENPGVWTTWKGNWTNQMETWVSGLSTTGCTIYGKTTAASQTRSVRWLAIGKKG